MRIEVNGVAVETGAGTLAALVAEQGADPVSVATALNGRFVPRQLRDGTVLDEGAKVELLSPMQGG
ncbi:MAG: sulfur carrier protein ThiS [Paracoccus sp. (in: a-proteobacteria)]